MGNKNSMKILTVLFMVLAMAMSVSAYQIAYNSSTQPADYTNEVVYYHFGDVSDTEGAEPSTPGSYLDYADSDLASNTMIDPINPRGDIVAGKWGNALSIRSDSFIIGSPTNTADVDFTSGDTIIETWLQVPAGLSGDPLVMTWNSDKGAVNTGLNIKWDSSNTVWLTFGLSPGWNCNPGYSQGAGWILEDNIWHHYTAHIDVAGNNIGLYRDGSLIDTVTGSECGGDVDTASQIVAGLTPNGKIELANGGTTHNLLFDQYIVHQGITDGLQLVQELVTEVAPTFNESVPDQDVYNLRTYEFTLNLTGDDFDMTTNSPYVTMVTDNATHTVAVTYNPQESIYEYVTFTATNGAGSDSFTTIFRVLLLGQGATSQPAVGPTSTPTMVIEPTKIVPEVVPEVIIEPVEKSLYQRFIEWVISVVRYVVGLFG